MRYFINIVESMVNIEGLPNEVEITDRELLRVINSPRYKVTARPDGGGDYELRITPANTDGMELYRQPAGRGEYHVHYDPERATLVPYDENPDYAMGRMKPQHVDGFVGEIEPLDGAVMYRGISAEEWAGINQSGSVKSLGGGNIGVEQEGLTYWTTDIRAAMSYAHGFAAITDKAAPGFPAFIIAAPLATDTKHVDGVAPHEVGVRHAVPKDELLAVWEGRVWAFHSTQTSLRQHWDGTWQTGGLSHPTARLEWKRIR